MRPPFSDREMDLIANKVETWAMTHNYGPTLDDILRFVEDVENGEDPVCGAVLPLSLEEAKEDLREMRISRKKLLAYLRWMEKNTMCFYEAIV